MSLRTPRKAPPIALIALSLLCLTVSTANAATDKRWFSIELIVFQQYMSPSYAENWPRNPNLEYPENLVQFPSDSTQNSLMNTFYEVDFQGRLSAAKKKLERARGQRILFAKRWHQGLLPKNEAPYVYIEGGKKNGAHHELEGAIQISVERYLHFKGRFWYSIFGEAEPARQAFEASVITIDSQGNQIENEAPLDASRDDSISTDVLDDAFEDLDQEIILPLPDFRQGAPGMDVMPVQKVYLFDQERRLRSKQTHYIDHPTLGVMLRIEPLKVD